MLFSKQFLFVVLLLSVQQLTAQLSVKDAPADLLAIQRPRYFASQLQNLPDLKTAILGKTATCSPTPPSLMDLRYQPHLAFFCRVEVKIDKAVGTPFRFRLGSVDYVDFLEGKRSDY